jgi:hypothetical protein
MVNNNKSIKAMPIVVAIMIMTMTIASLDNNSALLPLANAQKPDNVFGTIASIQNGKDGKPEWVT